MSNTPSDEDIVALAMTESIKVRTGAGVVRLVRAALAKWGTPQPVAREPLTDEGIEQATGAKIGTPLFLAAKGFVLATESAHGITQQGGSNAE